jgi:hypothetical protein
MSTDQINCTLAPAQIGEGARPHTIKNTGSHK